MGAHASDGLRPDNPIVEPEATKITGIARECLRAEAGNQLRAAGTTTAFSVPDTHETVPSLREAPVKILGNALSPVATWSVRPG